MGVYYYNNGKKQLEGHYLAGSSNLMIDYFSFEFSDLTEDAKGEKELKIMELQSVKHAPPNGIWKTYDKNGNRLQTFTFKNGLLVGIKLNSDLDD